MPCVCPSGMQELKPRLDELVDQESRWLEEQEAVRAAEEDAAAAEELERQQAESEQEGSDATSQDALQEECGADEAGSCNMEGSGEEQQHVSPLTQAGTEADGSARTAAKEADGAAAADWEDGWSEGRDGIGADPASADAEAVQAEAGDDAAEVAADEQNSAKGAEAAAAAAAEEEEELLDDVDSPWAEVCWAAKRPSAQQLGACQPCSPLLLAAGPRALADVAVLCSVHSRACSACCVIPCLPAHRLPTNPPVQEIKALDGQLAGLQERMRQLESELASLQNSGLIVSAGATPARRSLRAASAVAACVQAAVQAMDSQH